MAGNRTENRGLGKGIGERGKKAANRVQVTGNKCSAGNREKITGYKRQRAGEGVYSTYMFTEVGGPIMSSALSCSHLCLTTFTKTLSQDSSKSCLFCSRRIYLVEKY